MQLPSIKYLRPLKAKYVENCFSDFTWRDNLRIDQYKSIKLSPLGQLYRPFPNLNGEIIIDDTDYCANLEQVPISIDNTPLLRGRTFYGGYFRRIWGHFLMETITRLWPFFNNDLDISDYDNIVFFSDTNDENNLLQANYLWMFKLLGIEKKCLVFNRPIFIEDITIAEPGLEHDVYATPQIRNMYSKIRELGLKNSNKCSGYLGRKIFLTRSSLKDAKKDEINILILEKIFQRAGYTIVSPEKLSLPDMIAALDKCESIVSISGSTAHNFLMANPCRSCKFTVIERNAHFTTFQSCVDIIQDIRPDYVDAFYLPFMATSSGRLVLFGPTKQFKYYANDNNLDISLFTEKNNIRRKELKRYITRYRRYNGFEESFKKWEVPVASLLAEAIFETKIRYAPWLLYHIALMWYDWLTPRTVFRTLRYYLKANRQEVMAD